MPYDTWKNKRGPDAGKLKPVDKRRKMRWQVHYYDPIKGQWRDKFFDKKSGEGSAEAFEATVRVENNTGTFIDRDQGKRYLRDFVAEWLEVQSLIPSSYDYYERVIRLHIIPHLGHLRMIQVRRTHIQGWIKKMEEIAASVTVRTRYAILSGVFKSAVMDQIIGRTPCVDLALPDKPDDDKWIPSPLQVASLIDHTPERFQLAMTIAAAAGLRYSEIMGLEITDDPETSGIDFLRRKIRVRHQISRRTGEIDCLRVPKTKAGIREIDMPDAVAVAAAEHIRAGYTVTTTVTDYTAPRKADASAPQRKATLLIGHANSRPLWRTEWSDVWRKALVATPELKGLTHKFTTHTLRHYLVSLMVAGGADIEYVRKTVGHKDATTTLGVYTHLFKKDNSGVRTVIDAAFTAGRAELDRKAS